MSDEGIRLRRLETALTERLAAFGSAQTASEAQVDQLRAQVEVSLQMIGGASVQLEQTMALLAEQEADLQALRTAHETLRKILRRQVDEARRKSDEAAQFGPLLEHAAAESARLLQEYRLLHRHTRQAKADLRRALQSAKMRQAKMRLHASALVGDQARLHRNQAQFDLWYAIADGHVCS